LTEIGETVSENAWQTFNLPEEVEKQLSSGSPYREFLRFPSLSCGVYTLDVGSKDLQGPHDEDEVYFVVKGKAKLRIDGRVVAIGPESIVYVGATAEHSFFEIEEKLTLLVFFGSGGRTASE
jgi:mannose-6-phosphate isomerase-like protein (cupin superfamily)